MCLDAKPGQQFGRKDEEVFQFFTGCRRRIYFQPQGVSLVIKEGRIRYFWLKINWKKFGPPLRLLTNPSSSHQQISVPLK
jgi:hypothetical protein